ncbi:uncharacterized protein EI97DRAFT_126427 [Westerdykella ornata]|uniref:Secreted protein n=1 Tax=Westerdykella ornata TaxID=318751 RepID=A0A6A6JFD0_WESOR|nr:uncharacterized protein EI97DRAFT_126427 [Westerdykella ornata]KAF2274336.1 hypothetical protein EI97DRAFT_126427 [Westerdykella ornata]
MLGWLVARLSINTCRITICLAAETWTLMSGWMGVQNYGSGHDDLMGCSPIKHRTRPISRPGRAPIYSVVGGCTAGGSETWRGVVGAWGVAVVYRAGCALTLLKAFAGRRAGRRGVVDRWING